MQLADLSQLALSASAQPEGAFEAVIKRLSDTSLMILAEQLFTEKHGLAECAALLKEISDREAALQGCRKK